MPSLSSKRSRISKFIKNRTADSSLVVQTGFPTSIADVFIKNRAKFQKRKKVSNSNYFISTELVPDDPKAVFIENPIRIDENVGILDVKNHVRRKKFGFLVVKIVALVVLAVGKKWVVAGITILSFGLLILEFFGFLKVKVNEFDIANVAEMSSSDKNESKQFDISIVAETSSSESCDSLMCDVLTEKRDFDLIEEDLRKSPKRKRKFLRKLFRRKNRKQKIENESLLDECVVMECKEDEEYFSFEDTNEVIEHDGRDNTCEVRLWRWRNTVFVVVVLFGLLGGKSFAMGLTVVWYLLFGCARTMCKEKKIY